MELLSPLKKSKKIIIGLIEKSNNFQLNENINHHFEKFLNELKTNINKSKYRKVLKDIKEKQSKFIISKDYWITFEFQLKSIKKIIERKLMKDKDIKNILEWVVRFDICLDDWLKYLQVVMSNGCHWVQGQGQGQSISSDQINIQLEHIIKNTLIQIYHYALISKYEKRIVDCIGFLALGEKLVKFVLELTFLPETIFIIQKILLFTSSILIADQNYELSKEYQANCLRLSIKELYQRVDSTEGICQERMSLKELSHIRKCVMNIVIAFFQRGVCEENLGNLLSAIESYKQAKWFSSTFLKSTNNDIYKFMESVETRALNYNSLIKNIKINMNVMDQQASAQKSFKSKLYQKDKSSIDKYQSDVERIENLHFQEFDDNEVLVKKSDNIKYIMSTIKVVNSLLSDRFKSLVSSFSDNEFAIGSMSKDVRDRIQRKLNEVKAEKIYTDNQKLNKNKVGSDSMNDKNYDMYYSCQNDEKKELVSNNSNNVINNNRKNSNSVLNSIQNQSKSTKQVREDRNSIQKDRDKVIDKANDKDKIEKYVFSKHISNKSYLKKVNYLSYFENKEIAFQKDLLRIKKSEKVHIDDVDHKKLNQDCEIFFKKIIDNTQNTFIEDEKTHKKKEIFHENQKNFRKEEKLKSEVLKSFNYKSFNKLKSFMNKANKDSIITTVDMNEKNNDKHSQFKSGIIGTNKEKSKEREKESIKEDLSKKTQLINNQLEIIEITSSNLKKIIEPNAYKAKKNRYYEKRKEHFNKDKVNQFISTDRNFKGKEEFESGKNLNMSFI